MTQQCPKGMVVEMLENLTLLTALRKREHVGRGTGHGCPKPGRGALKWAGKGASLSGFKAVWRGNPAPSPADRPPDSCSLEELQCVHSPGACALRSHPQGSRGRQGTYLRHVYAPNVIPDPRGGQFPQATGSVVLQGGPGNGPDRGDPRGQPQLTWQLSRGAAVSCLCRVLSAHLGVQA